MSNLRGVLHISRKVSQHELTRTPRAPHAHYVSLALPLSGLHSEPYTRYRTEKTLTQEVLSIKEWIGPKEASQSTEGLYNMQTSIPLPIFFYAGMICSICTTTFNLLLDTDVAAHSLAGIIYTIYIMPDSLDFESKFDVFLWATHELFGDLDIIIFAGIILGLTVSGPYRQL